MDEARGAKRRKMRGLVIMVLFWVLLFGGLTVASWDGEVTRAFVRNAACTVFMFVGGIIYGSWWWRVTDNESINTAGRR